VQDARRTVKIALIAHLKYPIAEPFSGGLEMHTHMLARRLIARGHAVTLFAAEGSDPSLGLVARAHRPARHAPKRHAPPSRVRSTRPMPRSSTRLRMAASTSSITMRCTRCR
jgi:hypothetical protein